MVKEVALNDLYGVVGDDGKVTDLVIDGQRFNLVSSKTNPLTGGVEISAGGVDLLVPLGLYTWASKPAANTVPLGACIVVSDVPNGGRSEFYSDGTYWRYKRPVVLLSNGNPATTTSGTTETVLASCSVPKLLLADNGIFVVDSVVSYQNDANIKRLRLRLGGTGVDGTVLWTQDVTATLKFFFQAGFQNRNTTNSQVQTRCDYSGGFSATGLALSTASVDTSVAVNVYLTAECLNAANTVTLQRVRMGVE